MVGAPLIEGCLAWLECRVLPDVENQRRHDLFIAEVVAAQADARVFRDALGRFATGVTLVFAPWLARADVRGIVRSVSSSLHPERVTVDGNQVDDGSAIVVPGPVSQGDVALEIRHALTLPQTDIPETLPAGHTALWVFDLGESRVCTAAATLTTQDGDTLTISAVDASGTHGSIVFDGTPDSLRADAATRKEWLEV